MDAPDTTRPIMLSSKRFLDHVKDGHSHTRYCFILGAGASVASGIPLGTTLMRGWREDLLKGEDECTGYIEDCARACGKKLLDVEHLFKPDYKISSTDYFTFYDLRFAGMPPIHAYGHLQELMMKAEPSFGYYALAVLLEHTQNKLVITTNFDSLVEESLALYHSKNRALAIGHERLASFMRDSTNTDRPVIAKVHRDLLLHPMNSEKEQDKLDEKWVEPLRDALSKYTPIVIGYAGGDESLMRFLEGENLDTIYWCTMGKDENAESKRITDFLRKQEHGYLVSIEGFDHIMYQLMETLMSGKDYDTPDVRINEYAKSRADGYRRQKDRIAHEIAGKKDANSAVAQIKDQSVPVTFEATTDGATTAHPKQKVTDAELQTLDKLMASGATDAEASNEALRAFRNSSTAYAEGRLEDALALDDKAVELEPKSALYHHSRGTTLNALGRHDEALEEFNKAVELEPEEALYYHSCGIALNALGRREEALQKLDEAVRLDPNNALRHAYRGTILDALGRKDEAFVEKEKAVQLKPEDALLHAYLGSALYGMGRYREALAELDEAVRLEPNSAQNHHSRAIVLHKLGRAPEARQEEARARELDGEDAK